MHGDSSKEQQNILQALTYLPKKLLYQPKQINKTVPLKPSLEKI